MELIDPLTGEPAHRCDYATRNWFRRQPADTVITLVVCDKCGLLYKPSLEHLHQCEDLIDPYTGALLWPGAPDRCPGNGDHPKYGCRCENCFWFSECFQTFEQKANAIMKMYYEENKDPG